MELLTLIVAIAIVATVTLAVVVFGLVKSNMKLWIELKAMKQSTHTLQWIDPLTKLPPDDGSGVKFDKLSDEEIQKMTDDPLGAI